MEPDLKLIAELLRRSTPENRLTIRNAVILYENLCDLCDLKPACDQVRIELHCIHDGIMQFLQTGRWPRHSLPTVVPQAFPDPLERRPHQQA